MRHVIFDYLRVLIAGIAALITAVEWTQRLRLHLEETRRDRVRQRARRELGTMVIRLIYRAAYGRDPWYYEQGRREWLHTAVGALAMAATLLLCAVIVAGTLKA